MGCDVVQIELEDGEVLTWIHKYNDLLGCLRKLAGSKERLSAGAGGPNYITAHK